MMSDDFKVSILYKHRYLIPGVVAVQRLSVLLLCVHSYYREIVDLKIDHHYNLLIIVTRQMETGKSIALELCFSECLSYNLLPW